MGHSNDLDTVRTFPKDDQIWERSEHRSASSELVRLIPLGMLGNLRNCAVEFIQKCVCSRPAKRPVPINRGLGLIKGRRMNPNSVDGHCYRRARRRRRASSQGTIFVAPLSISCSRRRISSRQASSAPSSASVSRLSTNELMRAARASAGSSSASFKTSAASRAMCIMLALLQHALNFALLSSAHRGSKINAKSITFSPTPRFMS
jgi:hypothetical protein